MVKRYLNRLSTSFRRIREVDRLLLSDEKARRVVREIHPEICFWALAGIPMKYRKKRHEGYFERIAVMGTHPSFRRKGDRGNPETTFHASLSPVTMQSMRWSRPLQLRQAPTLYKPCLLVLPKIHKDCRRKWFTLLSNPPPFDTLYPFAPYGLCSTQRFNTHQSLSR